MVRLAVAVLALPAIVQAFAPLAALPSVGRGNTRSTQSLGLRMEWLKTVDKASGATYWYDTNTLESSWEPPASQQKAAAASKAALPGKGQVGYGKGRGLPEAREEYNFPGMNLLFGEGMLKNIMIPEWEDSMQVNEWGTPLPGASQATFDAYAAKKAEIKAKELANKSTYPDKF
mmetsp:Transcript_59226/g.140873  ORF Transcript_59226/g.140873 Transcript_59226/m.140873 type:complete len:174 (+) Transcript_59226:72-593(+)|eukprot:CAMPEP_0180150518 /NCGR_PEP_ID=MMETSP0986-20121125/21504_1 /TAXON_ID=697907 /ORGANISM="non described non described, Strain CCMP2293" /LENGTH=173 /DNA_ID=CAMNT_0022097483 /DNA_START=16 /DNA_END=537 /DNA_ORIENTATION=-